MLTDLSHENQCPNFVSNMKKNFATEKLFFSEQVGKLESEVSCLLIGDCTLRLAIQRLFFHLSFFPQNVKLSKKFSPKIWKNYTLSIVSGFLFCRIDRDLDLTGTTCV